jgi:succinate dehydrogenase/fumarate reductase-like Fe-S protein
VGETVQAKILRYSPEDNGQRVDTFEVPYRHGMTVQTLLRYVYENMDPSLAFRDFRCGRGICNTCKVKVNGKTVKSCQTLVKGGKELLVEPASDKVIKDLVTLME